MKHLFHIKKQFHMFRWCHFDRYVVYHSVAYLKFHPRLYSMTKSYKNSHKVYNIDESAAFVDMVISASMKKNWNVIILNATKEHIVHFLENNLVHSVIYSDIIAEKDRYFSTVEVISCIFEAFVRNDLEYSTEFKSVYMFMNVMETFSGNYLNEHNNHQLVILPHLNQKVIQFSTSVFHSYKLFEFADRLINLQIEILLHNLLNITKFDTLHDEKILNNNSTTSSSIVMRETRTFRGIFYLPFLITLNVVIISLICV